MKKENQGEKIMSEFSLIGNVSFFSNDSSQLVAIATHRETIIPWEWQCHSRRALHIFGLRENPGWQYQPNSVLLHVPTDDSVCICYSFHLHEVYSFPLVYSNSCWILLSLQTPLLFWLHVIYVLKGHCPHILPYYETCLLNGLFINFFQLR